MQNIEQLRASLLENYEAMKSKKMDLKEGRELTNVAGKVMTSLKIEMDYNAKHNNTKKIKFLEV